MTTKDPDAMRAELSDAIRTAVHDNNTIPLLDIIAAIWRRLEALEARPVPRDERKAALRAKVQAKIAATKNRGAQPPEPAERCGQTWHVRRVLGTPPDWWRGMYDQEPCAHGYPLTERCGACFEADAMPQPAAEGELKAHEVGFTVGELDRHGELELKLYVDGAECSCWLSREMWRAVGKKFELREDREDWEERYYEQTRVASEFEADRDAAEARAEAAEKRVRELEAERDNNRRWLDGIAAALHPHWVGDGHTYVADQLAARARSYVADVEGYRLEAARELKRADAAEKRGDEWEARCCEQLERAEAAERRAENLEAVVEAARPALLLLESVMSGPVCHFGFFNGREPQFSERELLGAIAPLRAALDDYDVESGVVG